MKYKHTVFDIDRYRIRRHQLFYQCEKDVEETHVIDIQAKTGRYGDTYVHKNIPYSHPPGE